MDLIDVRRRSAQYLVLLLQQPNTFLGLTQLGRLRHGHTRKLAGLGVRGLEPVPRARILDTEVLGDL